MSWQEDFNFLPGWIMWLLLDEIIQMFVKSFHELSPTTNGVGIKQTL